MLLTLQIREIVPVNTRARIVRIDLGGRRFDYRAGQALMIARHDHERRRPYSIATAPEDMQRDDMLELLVGVDSQGSPGPHLTLEPGACVDIEGPIGQFTVPDDASAYRFVFVAGGTGIAPIRAMLRHVLKTSHRHIDVVYSARTPADFVYDNELLLLAREGRIDLRRTVTREMNAQDWTGARGRIGRDDLAPLVEDPSTLCVICGPPTFVSQMLTLLDQLDIPQRQIRTDALCARPSPRQLAPAAAWSDRK